MHMVEKTVHGPLWVLILMGLVIAVLLFFVIFYRLKLREHQIHVQKLVLETTKLARRGRVSHPVEEAGPRDARDLCRAYNAMIGRFDSRVHEERGQRLELEAIMSNMVQGVFLVDVDERLVSINDAALRLLQVYVDRIEGRLMAEVIRNRAIQRVVEQAMSERRLVEDEIQMLSREVDNQTLDSRYTLQVHGSAVKNNDGELVGALVVLNDVSRLRRAESVRRDFVANVSHELKTPVAAIKGSAETASEALEMDPAATMRFLAVIIRQADRLHQIIEDLLSLARIEQSSEGKKIEMQPWRLADLIDSIHDACHSRAIQNNVTLLTDCDEHLLTDMNPHLMEQAVGNLVDNAIKYAGEGITIHVEASLLGDEINILVKDNGVGIAAKHLPRLFERFYRPDKARSRNAGGTGLGLAIVKHVAQAHGGRVSVESELGEGSIFRIHLPVNEVMIDEIHHQKERSQRSETHKAGE